MHCIMVATLVVGLWGASNTMADEYFPHGMNKWYYGVYSVCMNAFEAIKQSACDQFHIENETYNDPNTSADCGIEAKCNFWLHCVKPERPADEVPIALLQQIVLDPDGPYNWSRWLKDKSQTRGSVVPEKARHYYGKVSVNTKTYDVVIRGFVTQFCDNASCLPPEGGSECD